MDWVKLLALVLLIALQGAILGIWWAIETFPFCMRLRRAPMDAMTAIVTIWLSCQSVVTGTGSGESRSLPVDIPLQTVRIAVGQERQVPELLARATKDLVTPPNCAILYSVQWSKR